ncbi:MAG: ArsR family transcriptional regulator [Anaerolineae bacterium]|nr:ArsR family transcriptional regulator [Anaerolineae bacterium]
MELQETRRHIVEILKERGECTVDDLVNDLKDRLQRPITTVTIRHHLDKLQAEGLIEPPQVRRRETPGRPQYVYTLSSRGKDYFPNNYAGLAEELLTQLKHHLPRQQINVIIENVADRMASSAQIPDAPMPQKLDRVVAYMNQKGYTAAWEQTDGGFILTTINCPYERVASSHAEVCEIDFRLVASMLGILPRLMGRASQGHECCQYFVPQLHT